MISSFFGKKKKNVFSDSIRKRIDDEICIISDKKKDGYFVKAKTMEKEYYINILIDKKIFSIDIIPEKINKMPDYIAFLLLIDTTYPEQPPRLLTKTNFCTPSIMDGRDLMSEIIPEWTEKKTLLDVIQGLRKFILSVVNSNTYNFYGRFHLGSEYHLHNFDYMVISSFPCSVQSFECDKPKGSYNLRLDDTNLLILSDDALILFSKKETENGILVFWSCLFSITYLQINKKEKRASFIFYNNEENNECEFRMTLDIDNILFFRDTLRKKMSRLQVNIDTTKLIKGQNNEERLTEKMINGMSDLNVVDKHLMNIKEKIEKNEINNYTVNMFSMLSMKAIELSVNENNTDETKTHKTYLDLMQTILGREDVSIMMIESQKEIEKALAESKE